MEPKEDYLPKPSPQNIKPTPQTQAPQAVSDVEVMAPATAGAAFNEKPVRKKSDLSQNAASIKPENISMGSTHISSEMLAFEESIINGNFDEMKVNTAPSTMKTKAVAKPSAVAPSPSMKEEEAPVPSMEKEKSVVLKEEPVIKQNAPAPKPKPVKAPTKPYLQEEERKKTKSMPECKDCPDKQISQEAVQDMQVLTYDYAVKKFNEKSYADAHLKFDQYIKENPQSEDAGRAGIYDAICLVYLNKPEEAIKRLNELSSQKNFSDDAKWLKAAIFIDQDKNNEAVSLLQELVKTRTYKEKASKAIEDLR
jgi:TolA-binding protein